ncbi:MAG TPA: hypothetical protein VF092_17105 [Longimicrobium sp.]
MATNVPGTNVPGVPPAGRPKPFKGFLPWYWENYVLCLLFHLLVPLLPLGFELAFTGRVRTSSLLLGASFYIIGIGVSSASRLFFGASLVTGLIFAAIYGNAVSRETSGVPPAAAQHGPTSRGPLDSAPVWALLVFGAAHAGERYMRHVAGRASFLEFLPEEDG